MRNRNRVAWAVVGVVLSAGPAAAQRAGGATGGFGGTAGGIGGGNVGFGGLAGGQTGGGGFGMGTAGGGQQFNTIQAPPEIVAPSLTGGAGGGAVSTSNFLSGFFANPYFQGTLANAQSNAAPGGFGTALFGTTPGGGSIGFAGNQTTGFGASRQTGVTGLGSLGTGGRGLGGTGLGTTNTSAVVVPLPVQFSFPTIAQFPAAPVAAPQLQADISGMLARAGAIRNPAGVQVLAEGSTVTLRGPVSGADEARLVEGMVRLTPGVRAVRNELTFPAPTVPPR